MVASTKPIRVRPPTHKKYTQIGRLKRWKLVEVADAAADALIATDAELQPLRKSSDSK